MADTDIADLGMPADLFDQITELVALREDNEIDAYSAYDFAHTIGRIAYAHAKEHDGD